MPTITMKIAILDWGKAGKPMVIKCQDDPLILELPKPLKGHDLRCAEYATYELEAPANLSPRPKSVHLGFYGYLRVANAMCLQKSGVSIFDLGDARWKDAYEEQRLPIEMVDETLREAGFPSDDE
jgi:hypothetical protein